ncbi:hypothetical protein [Paenibacillus sp. FSL H8-0537]|uniref:hypothetical protein n=1 Tax=Paenibacillus sp. FSL H8-0537 TaxID=2921399 RepID=UPI0031011BA7
MCYFMYAATDNELNSDIFHEYNRKYNIYIEDITAYVPERMKDYVYYSINRQCACDFYSSDARRNNEKELLALLTLIKQSGSLIFCIVDDGNNKYEGISLQKVMESFPDEELTLDDFLNRYPIALKPNHVYKVS